MRSSIAFYFLLSFSLSVFAQEEPLELWYDQPAEVWMTEALPFGNGYIGAMFFGSPEEEHIQFSEGSLWSGGPGSNSDYNYGIRDGAEQHLEQVRILLKEGNIHEAESFIRKHFTGKIHRGKKYNGEFGDYGAQQTMGDIYVKTSHQGEMKNYKRSLDLSSGMGKVSYAIGDTSFKRTFYGNYPDRLMIYEFESSSPSSYRIRLESPHNSLKRSYATNEWVVSGKVADNLMAFETRLSIRMKDGTISYEDDEIVIENSTGFSILQSAATDYLPIPPSYSGNDYVQINQTIMEAAHDKSMQELRANHLKDYQELFNRVVLDLGQTGRPELPTDQRLLTHYESKDDRLLEALYFQFARYLMISGSRPETMSMHLQGKWNNSTNPPWAADYHSNINLEMIYWPAEVTNLSESHMPFLDYIESLVAPGKKAASSFFGTRGWIVNTMCNAFGYTSPGWGFPWGYFPGGAGWFAQHFWEHYAFTLDKDFLEKRAYPLMKEASLFWIDYLTEDENGFLVSIPSYSPEHGGISGGASMDHQIAWDLLNNTLQAAQILSIDDEFTREAERVRSKILPPKVGSWNQLQEWKEDRDEPTNQHRHVSHLFALHPGKQISRELTPDLANAAAVSLNARGDGGTGWSLAWKVNFWARLQDGNRAYNLFSELLKPVSDTGITMVDGGGTYANLLCAHPPFQLDGNMGGAAGLAELLLQSHTGTIELLPALPDVWSSGSVKGLKARGNFEVDMVWQNGKVEQVQLKGKGGAAGNLKINGQLVNFKLDSKGRYSWSL